MTPNKSNPLPISETLRDLALLRASDLDFAAILRSTDADLSTAQQTTSLIEGPGSDPANATGPPPLAEDEGAVGTSVERSYEFVKEARAALKILNRGDVDKEGVRVEDMRMRLDDMMQGLDASQAR